jgi:hypothetical protein
MPFLHPWMRRVLLVLGAVLPVGFSWFSWVAWGSPQARAGNRNLHASRLVQPGMRLQQALAIMGPPAYKRANPRGLFYVYTTHPLSSEEVTFWVEADSVVAGVSPPVGRR